MRSRPVPLVKLFGFLAMSASTWMNAPRLFAQEKADKPERAVYQPVGAPADPKVAAHWNRYHDYTAATRLLKDLATAHPQRCRLASLGQSYGKREMWLLTLSGRPRDKESESPAFWIDGGIHANEIQATEVALYTAWYLLESYGRSPLVTRLLDERVFYIVPMMSPDSRDAHMYEPNTTNSPRSGQRPIDDDRDGLVDEDKPDDLDGDGHITQMRIRDPNGRYKPHPDYPDLLIAAKSDERGSYTQLGEEGFDNDGDGRVNEDGDGYYDPNRDWAWNWQPRYVQSGAYRYPFSILENRMVADFLEAHPNIAGAQSYHNAGGMILRGPGGRSDAFESADVAVFDEIARKGELLLPGYRYMEAGKELYELFGGEVDYFYFMRGTVCYTNELFTSFNYFRQKPDGSAFGSPSERQQVNKYLLLGDGSVAWHEVEHPQYGKIEVGGLKKTWIRQPPSFLLEEECHRNMAFTLFHADQMPQIEVAAVETRPLDGGLTEVAATIINRKLTPTRLAAEIKRQLSAPDRITLEGKGLEVYAGLIADNVLFERPREQKLKPAEIKLDTVRSMAATYVRWIVRGPGPYTVTARSVKGGTSQRQSDVP